MWTCREGAEHSASRSERGGGEGREGGGREEGRGEAARADMHASVCAGVERHQHSVSNMREALGLLPLQRPARQAYARLSVQYPPQHIHRPLPILPCAFSQPAAARGIITRTCNTRSIPERGRLPHYARSLGFLRSHNRRGGRICSSRRT